jgi:hypothetical protein
MESHALNTSAKKGTMALDIFLLVGQSNMAGRGPLSEVDPLANPRIQMFRGNRWQQAQEPLHTDKPDRAGVGLASGFALELLQHTPGARIGLVPCAVGGTPLSRWLPGRDLYETAVETCNRALTEGALKGILWHQGESDANDAELAHSYSVRFHDMVNGFRQQFGSSEIPVIAGELGTFLIGEDRPRPYVESINAQLRDLVGILPAYGFAKSNGLTDLGDHVHFDAKSLREFGVRYAQQYQHLR